ncbi:MAG: dihydrodipicolinate synthase family protein [Cyclobacteriaceae bacterium]|nr:dihydrodipicolinate synthase family protein [Cyclobacteriaceae bacterium]
MKLHRFPEGLWPVMLTPFESDGSIDFASLDELTDFYLAHGAAGLFANCLSSEMYHLTAAERIKLVRAVLRKAGGRIPVIATGTFGMDIPEHILTIREMHDLGVTAVVLVTSQIAVQSGHEDVLKDNIEKILEGTGSIPLGLYECPVPYKRLLSPGLAGYLAGTGRFLYYKETSCDIREIKEKLSKIKGSPMGLYNANTPTALESLKEGAAGLSTISANFYPELYSLLCRLSISRGEPERIAMLQRNLSIMDAVTRIKYPLNAKLFLSWRGLKINLRTRVEVPPLHYEEIKMLESLFDHFNRLAHQFNLRNS